MVSKDPDYHSKYREKNRARIRERAIKRNGFRVDH